MNSKHSMIGNICSDGGNQLSLLALFDDMNRFGNKVISEYDEGFDNLLKGMNKYEEVIQRMDEMIVCCEEEKQEMKSFINKMRECLRSEVQKKKGLRKELKSLKYQFKQVMEIVVKNPKFIENKKFSETLMSLINTKTINEEYVTSESDSSETDSIEDLRVVDFTADSSYEICLEKLFQIVEEEDEDQFYSNASSITSISNVSKQLSEINLKLNEIKSSIENNG